MIFFFIIFAEKAEDFGVITSFSGGNGREISSPQQSIKGTIQRKIEFKLTANKGGRVGSYESYRDLLGGTR